MGKLVKTPTVKNNTLSIRAELIGLPPLPSWRRIVRRLLKVLSQFLVWLCTHHCWHGSDRTGLVSAMYRIVFGGWSKKEAIDELINGGYGYHSMYKNISEFIEKVDIVAIKQRVTAP